MTRKSSASHRRSSPKLSPAAARTTLMRSSRATFEMVALRAMFALDVADNGLDSRATLHLATNGSGDAADLARDPDPEPMRVLVTMMPLCRVDAASLHAGELLHVGNDKAERAPVEEIAMQCLGKEEELSALRRRQRVAILTLQPTRKERGLCPCRCALPPAHVTHRSLDRADADPGCAPRCTKPKQWAQASLQHCIITNLADEREYSSRS
ncbi:hypothetical protein ACVIHI_008096 [Bradyrhizobium sp. USDA 4524]